MPATGPGPIISHGRMEITPDLAADFRQRLQSAVGQVRPVEVRVDPRITGTLTVAPQIARDFAQRAQAQINRLPAATMQIGPDLARDFGARVQAEVSRLRPVTVQVDPHISGQLTVTPTLAADFRARAQAEIDRLAAGSIKVLPDLPADFRDRIQARVDRMRVTVRVNPQVTGQLAITPTLAPDFRARAQALIDRQRPASITITPQLAGTWRTDLRDEIARAGLVGDVAVRPVLSDDFRQRLQALANRVRPVNVRVTPVLTTNTVTVRANVNTTSASGQLNGMATSFGQRLHSVLLAALVIRALPNNPLDGIANKITLIAGAAASAAGAAAPLVAAIAGLGAAGGIAAAGIGSFVAIAKPQFAAISAAVKAVTKAQDEDSSSASGVASAQRSLAAAHRQAAQTQVSDAQAISSAQDQLRAAQLGVNQARQQAVIDLRNLEQEQHHNALSVREATLGLQQQQIETAKTLASSSATALDKQFAVLHLDEAKQQLVDVRQAANDSAVAYTAAKKAGVEGSAGVVTAKQQEKQAQQSLADAQRKAADDQIQAADQIASAAAALAQAQQGANKSANDAAKALAKLTPAQRVATLATLQFRDAFMAVSNAQAGPILGAYAQGLHSVQTLLPLVGQMAGATGTALLSIFQRANAGVTAAAGPGGGLRQFADLVSTQIGPILTRFAQIAVNVGGTLSNVFRAAVPAIDPVLSLIQHLTAELRGASAGPGLGAFFAQATAALNPLHQAVSSVVGALGALIQAALPLAGPVLLAVSALASALKGLFQSADFASFVRSVSSIVTQLTPLFATLAGVIGQVVSTLGGQFAALLPVLIPVVSQLAQVFGSVLVGLSPLLPAIVQLIGALVPLVPILYPIITAARDALIPVLGALSQVMVAIRPQIGLIVAAFITLLPPIAGLLIALIPLIPAAVQVVVAMLPLVPVIIQILNAVIPLVPQIIQLALQLLPVVSAFVALAPVVVPVVKVLADVAGKVLDILNGLGPLGGIIGLVAGAMALWGGVAVVQAAALVAVNVAIGIFNLAMVAVRLVQIAWTLATIACTGAIWLLNAALAVLTSPITLVVLAVAAVAAGVIYAYTHFKVFRDIVDGVMSAVWGIIRAVMGEIAGIISSVLGGIEALWQVAWAAISTAVKVYWDLIRTEISVAITLIRAIITVGLDAVRAIFTIVFDAIKTVVVVIFDVIKAYLQVTWITIRTIFSVGLQAIKAVWDLVWGAIKATVDLIFRLIRDIVTGNFRDIGAAFSAWTGSLGRLWGAFWGSLKAIASTVFDSIKQVIGVIWGAISGIFHTFVGFVTGAWTTFWGSLKAIASTVFNAAKGIISTVLGGIQSAFGATVGGIKKLWDGLVGVFKTPINIVIDVVNGFDNIVNSVTDAVGLGKPLPHDIHHFQRGGRLPGYGGGDIVPALLEPGETVVPKHLTPVFARQFEAAGIPGFTGGGLIGGIIPHLPGPLGDAQDWVGDKIKAGVGALGDAASWVADKAQHLLREGAAAALSAAVGPIRAGLGAVGGHLPGTMVAGAANHALDQVIDWVRGKEQQSAMTTADAGSIVALARQYLGVPYQFGGTTTSGWDCSGFTSFVYNHVLPGSHIPRTSEEQWGWAQHTPGPVEGGLIFYNPGEFRGGLPGHVGIVSGPGRMIDAPHTGARTREESIWSGAMGYGVAPGTKVTAPLTGGQFGPVSPVGSLQQYAQALLNRHGWSGQWDAFSRVVARESGWNPLARNPNGGAFGIPQALPPEKMASAGPDWRTNGQTQLRWMIDDYIPSRWGDPAGAWANEVRAGWYRSGGVAKGWSVVGDKGIELMNVGSPSRVLSNEDTRAAFGAATSGGAPLIGTAHIREEADAELLAARLDWLQRAGAL
jgi:phage-related protein